jgi:uncharacterized protein (TIGR03435 family)
MGFVKTTPPLAWAALLSLPVFAQAQPDTRRQFEVASVRPSDPNGRSFVSSTPARFTATNVRLITYIATAYGVDPAFVKGLPQSMADAQYDITANATDPDDVRPPGAMRHWAEMQKLLEDRFKLEIRLETTLVPALKLLRGKGELKLQKSTSGQPLTWGPIVTPTPGKLKFVSITMPNLAFQLRKRMGAELPIVDETGIEGAYDFSIDYPIEEPAPSPERIREVLNDLGLTLQGGRVSQQTLVVLRVEKPSAN